MCLRESIYMRACICSHADTSHSVTRAPADMPARKPEGHKGTSQARAHDSMVIALSAWKALASAAITTIVTAQQL